MICCEHFHIIKNQLLATISANILIFSTGSNLGWFSPALPLLMSEYSPLDGDPISANEAGWIGSFLSIGALCGCLILSFVSNYIGNKKTILICSIPITISGLFIIFGKTALHICLSRFCCGFAWGGGMLLIPQFVAEIASDFNRGELSSYLQTSNCLGILVGTIGGSYFAYEAYPMIMIVFPMIFLCTFVFMPDTPQYLLATNKIDLAEDSLRFYRNCPKGNGEKETALQETFEKFIAITKQRKSAVRFSEFVTPTVIRAMMISPILNAISTFSGSMTIIIYSVLLFDQTGSSFDPNVSAIVMTAFLVFGTYTASQLIDRLGRKTLLLISISGGFVAVLVTGIYAYLGKQGFDLSSFSILPVISISFYVFISAIGMLPVPFVMVSEVLPQRIRRVGATIYTCMFLIFTIIMLKIFPTILFAIGVHGIMFLFGCVLAIGLIFTLFVVRETKGINLEGLENKDNNKT